MTGAEARLEKLRSEHPEWTPWLAVVEAVLREIDDHKWDSAVPPGPASPASATPLLANAAIDLREAPVQKYFTQLIGVASRSGTETMVTLAPAANAKIDLLSLFKASLHQDNEQLKACVAALGVDCEAFAAVMALLSMPLLQACNRRLERSVPTGWTEGYCPICGAWPAFAEVRG
ncbi:MAG: formate dehydrogenase accessory protein FdhE, partial [Deltaproteobacteria bacterium]|nr:formate dehydrogenase accessory protein FdhE [Deltaproteobacteria bacterium]